MNTTQYMAYSAISAIIALLLGLNGMANGQHNNDTLTASGLKTDTLATQVGYFLDVHLLAPIPQLGDLRDFINELENAANKRNKRSLARHVFYRTQQKYLKKYRQFSSLGDVLERGHFDCVSASALYAIIFTKLDINYKIHETDYHVYLMLYIDDKEILIETTDRQNGFIEKPRAISQMLKRYQRNTLPEKVENVYTFSHRVNGSISLQQLAGLQFYNLAVCRFNGQDFDTAQSLVKEALLLYRSERILEFQELMVGL